MKKFTRAFWFLTIGIILLCFISAFSPLSNNVDSSTMVDNKLKPLRIPTGRTDTEFEILLGQTKYYQAITNRNKLVIVESTEPKLQGGASNVTFEVLKESRDTLGVYFDNKDEQGNALPSGMIRLVGRYWDGGELYKVRLTAKRRDLPLFAEIGHTSSLLAEIREGYDVGSVVIDVRSPLRLGTTNSTITDCLGNPIDLDSIIIKFAGENGIPPQIIKGQIENESSFKPAYRWEPLVDATNQMGSFFKPGFRYLITKNPNSEGDPPIPTDHRNAQPAYPRYYNDGDYKTIWNWFYESSVTLNPSAKINKYPARSSKDNRPLWYKNAVTGWEEQYSNALISALGSFIFSSVAYSPDMIKSARETANSWLKQQYQMDKVAQTRASASYGFLQMTYPTAVTKKVNYPKDFINGTTGNLPEYINLTSKNFELCVPFLRKNLEQEIKDEGDPPNAEGNWKLGFEETIRVALNMYNGMTEIRKTKNFNRYNWGYGKPILTSSLKYKPS